MVKKSSLKKLIPKKPKNIVVDKKTIMLSAKNQKISSYLKDKFKVEIHNTESMLSIIKFNKLSSKIKINKKIENTMSNIMINKLYSSFPEKVATKYLESITNLMEKNIQAGNKYFVMAFTNVFIKLLIEGEKSKSNYENDVSKYYFYLKKQSSVDDLDLKNIKNLIKKKNKHLYEGIVSIEQELKK